LSLLLLDSTAGAASRMPCLTKLLSPIVVEVSAAAVVGINAALQFVIDPWYAAQLSGIDPKLAFADQHRFSDTRVALALSALLLGSHIIIPIRWFVLAPLEVFVVLTYAVYAFVVGGSDGLDAWTTLLLIVALVATAAIGRRTIERHERESLRQLIRERNLRVTTESRLSQMERGSQEYDMQEREADGLSSLHESRPETTASAAVLQSPMLEDVTRLGLQEQWLIDASELEIRPEILGKGSFGRITTAVYHGTPVAVKAAIAPEERGEEGAVLNQLNELKILRRLRHPNIVLFHGAALDPEGTNLWLVLERLQGVTLEAAVLAGGSQQALCPHDAIRLLLDICRALAYLHSRHPSVVHGDLKAANIFVERPLGCSGFARIKLLDFGLSRSLTRHARPLGGSPMWVAPEVIVHRGAPQAHSDIFSLGRLVFFAMTGRKPCMGMSKRSILKGLRNSRPPQLLWPEDAGTLAVACRPLVEACSSPQPDLRPTIAEVQRQLEAVEATGSPIVAACPGLEAEETVPAISGFGVTPRDSLHLILDSILHRVNFLAPPANRRCCLYHEAVRNLYRAIRGLEVSECNALLHREAKAQCQHCQALLFSVDEDSHRDVSVHLGNSALGSQYFERRVFTCFLCGATSALCTRQSL